MCNVGVIHTYSTHIGGEGNKHSLILVEGHSSRFIIIFTIGPTRLDSELPTGGTLNYVLGKYDLGLR
jgi:hypothetical protein